MWIQQIQVHVISISSGANHFLSPPFNGVNILIISQQMMILYNEFLFIKRIRWRIEWNCRFCPEGNELNPSSSFLFFWLLIPAPCLDNKLSPLTEIGAPHMKFSTENARDSNWRRHAEWGRGRGDSIPTHTHCNSHIHCVGRGWVAKRMRRRRIPRKMVNLRQIHYSLLFHFPSSSSSTNRKPKRRLWCLPPK